jgi:hypothetical protein
MTVAKKVLKGAVQKRTERQKLKTTLDAVGEPINVHELLKHPALRGSGISTRSAGQHLKFLAKGKEILFKGKQMWAPLKKRELPAVQQKRKVPKAAEAPSGMFFVLNPELQTVMLDVGGLRLPVIIEK